MTARHKLNVAVLNGSLITALIVGLLTQSVAAFVLVLLVLLAGSLYSKEMRL